MDNILSLITERRLLEALDAMNGQTLALKSNNVWEIQDRLQKLRQSYNSMLGYFSRGIADPEQETVYNGIQKESILLYEQISFELRLTAGATASRYSNINQEIQELAEKLELLQNSNPEHENTITCLFNKIWSWSGIWSMQEYQVLDSLFQDSSIALNDKLIIVTAITMSCLEEFHPLKYRFLLSQLNNNPAAIVARAAVGTIMIACRKNDIIRFFPELTAQIRLLSDNSDLCSLLCSTWFGIQRCVESLDIEKIMTQDIIPTIVKHSQNTLEELEDINPDWEKMGTNTQLHDKIEELNRLQQEGADVYLSTFRHLRNGSFFNDAINCLRPFDINIPQVQSTLSNIHDKQDTLSVLLEKSVMMCNSDKYSLLFTLASVGSSQYSMLLNQFEEQNEFVNSNLKSKMETLSGLALTESMIRIYIQDMFRLLAIQWKNNKYRHIYDIFENSDEFMCTSVFDTILNNTLLQNRLLDFYIKKGYHNNAYQLCRIMEKQNNAEFLNYKFYQKYGYAAEHRKDADNNRWENVLALYSKADLLDSKQIWTWKHLANTYSHLGSWEKAAEYWEMVIGCQPENISAIYNAAHAWLMSENTGHALELLYKAFYLSPDSVETIKEIALAETLNGNIANAGKYWNKIKQQDMSAADYIQLGHYHYISNNIPQALDTYKKALETAKDHGQSFRELFMENLSVFQKHNIDPTAINLIIDSVMLLIHHHSDGLS